MTVQPPVPPPRPGPGEPPLPPLFEQVAPAPEWQQPGGGGGSKRLVAIVLGIALLGGAGVGVYLVGSKDKDSGATGRALIPAGWKTHNLTSEGFRLGLPPAWQNVSPGEVDSALEDLRADNPELADLIEEQVSGSLSSLVRFFAFDTKAPTLEQGFATNVNVVVEPLPVSIDFDTYIEANLTQLRKVPGVSVVEEKRDVGLPAGRAALIKSRFALNSPSGQQEVFVTQYLMLKGEKGFILSMTTTPEHESTYASLFEQIAKTFGPL